MTSRLDNVGSEPVYLCMMGPVLQSTKSLVWLQEDQTYASRLEETEGITGGVSGHAAVGELCSQTIQAGARADSTGQKYAPHRSTDALAASTCTQRMRVPGSPTITTSIDGYVVRS